MAAVLGNQIGKVMCEALGLDANKVKSIDIHVGVNDVVIATIVEYPTTDKMELVTRTLEAIEWREAPCPVARGLRPADAVEYEVMKCQT